MLNFLTFVKKSLIYGLIFCLGISALLLLDIQKTSAKGEALKSESSKITFSESQCSKADNVYFSGEKITCSFDFGPAETAWADLSGLEPNFSSKINLISDLSGTWQLQSPTLSESLIPGGHIIKVSISDSQGRIFGQDIKVFLKKLPQITIVSLKTQENSATLAWKADNQAEEYLLTWQAQGEEDIQIANLAGKISRFQMSGLKPATAYQVTLWPFFDGQRGRAVTKNFQTLGLASAKKVAGTETKVEPTRITPAIGEGVSTVAPVSQARPAPVAVRSAQQTPATPEQQIVTPTPSPSPSPAASEDTGNNWNKLLIALSIIIIAAGVAIGGYYGYEWLVLRRKDDEEEPPAKPGNRW